MGRPGGSSGGSRGGGFGGGFGGGGFNMRGSIGHSGGHSSSGHRMSGSGGGRPVHHNYNSSGGSLNSGFGGGFGGDGFGRRGGSFFDTVGRYYMLKRLFGMGRRKNGNIPYEGHPSGNAPHEGYPLGNAPYESYPSGNTPHESHPSGSVPVGSAGESYQARKSSDPPKFPAVRFILGLLIVLIGLFSILSSSGSGTVEKIADAPAYISDCVIDEDAWFDSPSGTGRALKDFYDKTGIQPYIVIKSYEDEFADMSDGEKDAYADRYFTSMGLKENTLLYMYFAEPDDYTIGYMTLIKGKQTGLIVDDTFTDRFWSVLDAEWDSAPSSDSLFADAFGKTADSVMGGSRGSLFRIFRLIMINLGTFLCVSAMISYRSRMRDYRERQKQKHVEHILNTDLDSLADELADKYTKGGN